ncbi:DBH-like monooxygenase protein 1 homolog [Ptychodera flava]|uniref:DBH-like monooxygenase protein 1 homolog n=1 Tax=Ptychodera flava TaxID=63121 RepID=UPI00396A58AB
MSQKTALFVLQGIAIMCVVDGFVTPTDTYTHNAALDDFGKVHLFWKYDDTTITFEVHAETLGYVGFGISPNGGMTNSDIVIGWVKDGNTYLKDRFASANGEPIIDDQQDYQLIGGMETETHTVLTISRKLDTCDEKDRVITSDTLRLIYAYHADDPDTETGLPYHGAEQRGSRSVHLLGVAPVEPEMPTGDDLLMYEFLNPHYEPIIQEGHEALVHHILIYQCRDGVGEGYHGFGHECYSPNMPQNLTLCTSVIISWAIGGGGFYFPQEAGFSLGDVENGDPDFVLMETHFDNPEFKDTFIDSSGIRVYYTPKLRKNDASIIEIGAFTNPLALFIPPGAPSMTVNGYCSQECFDEGSNGTSITIFASLLHSHLAGVKLRARHFREGVEKDIISEDDTYDFNLQEMRHLKEPAIVQPGDRLTLECNYNTESRTNMTYGGLSTTSEMCLSYLYYYPRIQLARCESLPVIEFAMNACCNVTKISFAKFPPIVVEPEKYRGMTIFEVMDAQEWTYEQVKDFEAVYQHSYRIYCEKNGSKFYPSNLKFEYVPEITEPLPEQVSYCKSAAGANRYRLMAIVIPAVVEMVFATLKL